MKFLVFFYNYTHKHTLREKEEKEKFLLFFFAFRIGTRQLNLQYTFSTREIRDGQPMKSNGLDDLIVWNDSNNMIVRFLCLEEQKENSSSNPNTHTHIHTKKKKRT